MTSDPSAAFATLLETIRHLRDPEAGCPWDLEQTHRSLREALVEESYEALDALSSGDPAAMVEELGDLLMQVMLNAQIGKDDGTFEIGDVLAQLNEKLVRRHPHVFGEERARTAAEGIGHWERMKAAEREMRGDPARSMLGGVPKAMPALAYAYAVLGRARRAGFDWDDPDTIFEKLAEEVRELAEAAPGRRTEEELGDVLFAVAGAAVRIGVDPEQALRGANARFYDRFAHVEQALRNRGAALADAPAADKLALWEEAKRAQADSG